MPTATVMVYFITDELCNQLHLCQQEIIEIKALLLLLTGHNNMHFFILFNPFFSKFSVIFRRKNKGIIEKPVSYVWPLFDIFPWDSFFLLV
jgi:hypothetical protein